MTKIITLPAMIFLGVFVAGVELPCTGGPYLAILVFLSQNFNFTAFLWLVVYNIIFVMPLIVILLMIYFGVKIQNVKRWKQSKRTYMRLSTGILLVFLGWLLILIANGTITLN
jgi:cytochrome c biogenesis protein CcdA